MTRCGRFNSIKIMLNSTTKSSTGLLGPGSIHVNKAWTSILSECFTRNVYISDYDFIIHWQKTKHSKEHTQLFLPALPDPEI